MVKEYRPEIRAYQEYVEQEAAKLGIELDLEQVYEVVADFAIQMVGVAPEIMRKAIGRAVLSVQVEGASTEFEKWELYFKNLHLFT